MIRNTTDISRDIKAEATFLVENNSTIRQTAEKFGVSKSTLHVDVTRRLRRIDAELYRQVRELLEINLAERHIRGGIATKEKWSRYNTEED